MGFKSFLLLIIIIFIAIFSLQNLQSISLVFWGFSSLSLPLSIWILLSFLAGIISSLLVQLLTKKPRPSKNYQPSFTSPAPNYPPSPTPNYPPSPSINEPVSSPQTNRKTVISPPQVNYKDYAEEDLDIFDDQQMEALDDRHQKYTIPQPIPTPTMRKTEPVVRSSIPEQEIVSSDAPKSSDINQQEEKQTRETDTEPLQKPESSALPEKSPVNEMPSEAWLKAREASLYSYQPKERTEIKTPPQRQENIKNKPSPNSVYRKSRDGIYDAPYRVIPPSREVTNENEEEEVYWEDEDDDWDF